jgi:hypothetical protein
MERYGGTMAVCIGGFTLALAEACLITYLDPHAHLLQGLTILIALLYLAEVWVLGRIHRSTQGGSRDKANRAEPAAEAAPGERDDEHAPGPRAQAVGGWDDLPLLAVPRAWGRDGRAAVIAFAARHGLRPYEAERGFVFVDGQGNVYRATVN